MPIEDYRAAAQKIDGLLKTLTGTGGLRLKYRITAGPGAADPDGLESREIYVEMAGPDQDMLLERNAELLHSIEHIAAKALRLEMDEHDRVSFDANGYKAMRARELRLSADTAVARVRSTGQPYSFSPMSSRERRLLHLALRNYDDMRSESNGEGRERSVVVYPKDWKGTLPRVGLAGSARTRGFGRR
ncbi:MAG TPA: R3H domain-containing nucleic acid-binding protein [Acidobacteriaceae bacterium]|jgi:spoIIIJ-associated protein|nr:R3H domain-containing nucleic acid-binding protein [Acidobacteriaceae bacterium]